MNTETVNQGTRDRLSRVQAQLAARGVGDFKLTLGSGLFTLQQVAEDTANAMEAYLEGRFHPMRPLEDSCLKETSETYYREVRELLTKTRTVMEEAASAHRLSFDELLRATGRSRTEFLCAREGQAPERSRSDPDTLTSAGGCASAEGGAEKGKA